MYNKLPNVYTDLKLFSDINESSLEFGSTIILQTLPSTPPATELMGV